MSIMTRSISGISLVFWYQIFSPIWFSFIHSIAIFQVSYHLKKKMAFCLCFSGHLPSNCLTSFSKNILKIGVMHCWDFHSLWCSPSFTNSNLLFIAGSSFADTKEGRYNPKMDPVIPVQNWRKGSQVAIQHIGFITSLMFVTTCTILS